MCVFSLQFLSETFLILRIQRDIIINIPTSSCKVPVNLVRSKLNLNSLDGFFKNDQISNFTKICPVGGGLLREGGKTNGQARSN